MVAIIRTEWEGTSGGPGLTQLALMGGVELTSGVAQGAVNAVRTFWDAMKVHLPDEVRLTVMPTMDVYNDADGELIASYVAPVAPAVVLGTGVGAYAGGAGLKINWNTGVIRNGRRVRGATFLVPAVITVFTNTGNTNPTTVTAINTACTNLMTALASAGAPLVVWSRPLVKDKAVIRNGASAGVLNGAASTKSAIMRGRRD